MSALGGIIRLAYNGKQLQAKGNFEYDLGEPVATGVAGADAVHGYTEEIVIPMIEGVITDSADLDLAELASIRTATVTLELNNGKTVVLREAWWASGSKGSTEAGEIPCKFEGKSGDEY